MEINIEPIQNGWIGTFNQKIKIYFAEIEELQRFTAEWQHSGEPTDKSIITRIIEETKNHGLGISE